MGANSHVLAAAGIAACLLTAGCAVDSRDAAETQTSSVAGTTSDAPFHEFNQDGTYEICSGMMCDFPAGT